jgi:hypothetical protein
MTQHQLAIKRALNDAEYQIDKGTMCKLSEECPEDHENFHTLALLYSDDDGGEIDDPEQCQADIYAALEEKFPEYAE